MKFIALIKENRLTGNVLDSKTNREVKDGIMTNQKLIESVLKEKKKK